MRILRTNVMYLSFVVFVIVLGACTSEEVPSISDRRPTPTEEQQGPVRNFQTEVFCSDVKLRTGVAALSWELTVEELVGQRVDVTIYKDGYEKGIFTSLVPDRQRRFTPPEGVKLPDRPDMEALLLIPLEIQQVEETGGYRLVVEGLEPGLNYFWRISTQTEDGWVPAVEEQVFAPVCPADLQSDGGS